MERTYYAVAQPAKGAEYVSPSTHRADALSSDDLLLVVMRKPWDRPAHRVEEQARKPKGRDAEPYLQFANATQLHEILWSLDACGGGPLYQTFMLPSHQIQPIANKARAARIIDGELGLTSHKNTRSTLDSWDLPTDDLDSLVSLCLLSDVIRAQRDLRMHSLLMAYLAGYEYETSKKTHAKALRVTALDEHAEYRQGNRIDIYDDDKRELCFDRIRLDLSNRGGVRRLDDLYYSRLGECESKSLEVRTAMNGYIFGPWFSRYTVQVGDESRFINQGDAYEYPKLLMQTLKEEDDAEGRQKILRDYAMLVGAAFHPLSPSSYPISTSDGLRLENSHEDPEYKLFEMWGTLTDGLLNKPRVGTLGVCRYCRRIFRFKNNLRVYCDDSCRDEAKKARRKTAAEAED